MSGYLEWQDGYRIGVARFDEEHKALLDRINGIVNARLRRREMRWERNPLGTLVEDILHEFDHEEIIMESTYYPERELHRGSHDRLLRKLMRHIEMCRVGEISTADFGTHLYDWFLEHIVQEDIKFGAYLRERGMR